MVFPNISKTFQNVKKNLKIFIENERMDEEIIPEALDCIEKIYYTFQAMHG